MSLMGWQHRIQVFLALAFIVVVDFICFCRGQFCSWRISCSLKESIYTQSLSPWRRSTLGNPRSRHLSLETESELSRPLYAVKLAGCHPQKSGCEEKSHLKFSNLITSPCPQNLKLCQVKETWGEPSPCSFWLRWAHSRSILQAGRLRPSIQPECSLETGWKRGGR